MLSVVRRLFPSLGRKSKAENGTGEREENREPELSADSQASECWQTVEEIDSLAGLKVEHPVDSSAGASSRRKLHRYLSGTGLQLPCQKNREYLIADDISNGREIIKIPAFSYKRNDRPPSDYHYVTHHIQYEPIQLDSSLKILNCCDCQGNCIDGQCSCSSNLYSGISYDATGILSAGYNIDSPEVIYECNAACKCNKRLCGNSVIQNGARCKLMLFRTKSRGWGVKTMEDLKRGTFIGVYSGELITAATSLEREDDTYLFNLAATTIHYSQQQAQDEGAVGQAQASKTDEHFVCDAKYFGNVTRFINHSCEPNVIGIRSYTSHQDLRFPYIAFFANQDIKAKSELLLNYGDNYWLVKCRRDKIYCLCRAPSCRFNKRRFSETLRRHNMQRRSTN